MAQFFNQLAAQLGQRVDFDFDALAGQGIAPPLGASDYTRGWNDRPFFAALAAAPAWGEDGGFQYGGRRPPGTASVVGSPAVSAYMARRQARKQAAAGQSGQSGSTGPDGSYTGAGMANVSDSVLQWYPLAKKYADQYGVPVEAVLAIIHNESGGTPTARSGVNPGDQGRAVGLMQLIPKYHGADGADLTNPEINVERGVKYFAQAYNKRGHDPQKAMAEYFGGGGAFDSAGNIRMDIRDININMAGYLQKFQAASSAYKAWVAARGQVAPQASAQATSGGGDLWGWLGGQRQPITGRFGEQEGPYPGTGHRGLDIGAPLGSPLTSPIAGTVIAAGDVGGGYGNQVRIQTAFGSVLLGHLSRVNVRVGDRVTPGMYLGATGSTGKSSGPHLHFELRDGRDNPIDPARYYRW